MEQISDVGQLVEQGDALLLDGQALQAAASYARALQADGNAVGAHLGLAKANLALGSFGTVYLACRQVQTLAPESEAAVLARALLYVVERRYDAAASELERYAELAPADAYAHALRGYCLRQIGQSYDAQLADAKARRLSSGKEFTALFPRVLPLAVPAGPAMQQAQQTWGAPDTPGQPPRSGGPVQTTSYSPPNQYSGGGPVADPELERQREAMRSRLQARAVPVATYTLIAINVLVYLACAAISGTLLSPLPTSADGSLTFTLQNLGPLYYYGIQVNPLIHQDPTQWYRVFTAMFLHYDIAHIGLNMLSLYFVGVATEQLFGRGRFLLIYFASGIAGGLALYFLSPADTGLGASGAIFGIFGAFGAFVILRRNLFRGAAGPIILQWLFWLALNIAFSFTPGIGLYDHLGGVICGFVLGALLIPRMFNLRRTA